MTVWRMNCCKLRYMKMLGGIKAVPEKPTLTNVLTRTPFMTLHILSLYCFESIRPWLIKHTREHGPSIVNLNFDVGMLFAKLA